MQMLRSVSYGVLLLCAAMCGGAQAEDVTIQTAGTYSFSAGVAGGALVNAANDGLVTFAPNGETTSGQRISFTSFDATVSGAQTTFSGGFWDFGATDLTTNFWTTTSTLSNRETSLANGANLTGVGTAWIAGSSGTDNTLALSGASSMTVQQLVFGAAKDQRSAVSVTGGSLLTCLGDVYLSRASVSTDAKSRTDNELLVSGAQSKLTVGGVLSVGGQGGGKNNWGLCGGNTVTVTDGATADLQNVEVGMGSRQGKFNRIVFGKDARVTMSKLSVASQGTYSVSSNVIEIADGAVVTNTGAFYFGKDASVSGYNTLFISNATFSTDSGTVINTINYLIPGANCEIRLSGPDAQFVSQKSINSVFKNPGSTFTVENGATYNFPASFTYSTITPVDETLAVRSGATVTTTASLTTSDKGTNNRVVVDGGTLDIAETLKIVGCRSSLVVKDGYVETVRSVYIGDGDEPGSTNCLMVLRGRSPKIYAGYNVLIQNGSTLRFELPPEGYAAGYATTETPVIMAGNADGSMGIKPSSSSRVELTGAQAMLDYFTAHGLRGEYVLMRTNKNIAALEGLAEKLQQDMPDGVTVQSRVKNNKWELVLTVKPKKGMVLIFR